MQKLEKKYFYSTALLILFAVLVSGYFLGAYIQKNKYVTFLQGFKQLRENNDKYTLINPLVGGISPPSTTVGIYSDLQEEILSYLKKQEKSGALTDHSFYFRDLGTGFWFGLNETADFSPASLFKLPIAIAVYKQGEDDDSFLKKRVLYTKETAQINNIVSSNAESSLVIGDSYAIEDLVFIMLTQSDNGAKNLLLSAADKKYINQLFSLISLAKLSDTSGAYEISSRKYALFLRMLYGSSYINEEHSELILKLLSESTFKEGLIAGIPKGTVIAHKYGVYDFEGLVKGEMKPMRQLHDCGIVYHEERPYVFCLMTKGEKLSDLYNVISHISKLVYDYQEEGK